MFGAVSPSPLGLVKPFLKFVTVIDGCINAQMDKWNMLHLINPVFLKSILINAYIIHMFYLYT